MHAARGRRSAEEDRAGSEQRDRIMRIDAVEHRRDYARHAEGAGETDREAEQSRTHAAEERRPLPIASAIVATATAKKRGLLASVRNA